MVRLRVALGAEVLLTVVAPNPAFGQVPCRFIRNGLSFVILLPFNHLAWDKLHDVSTLATDKVLVDFDDLHLLCLLDLVQFLLGKKFVEFVCLNDPLALWALD